MTYQKIRNDIANENILRTYLFVGEEEYLMNETINNILDKFINPSFKDINYDRLEGKEIELEDLISACETLPFMSQKRVVLLNNINDFMLNLSNREKEELYPYLENLGDFVCLILLDKENKLRKNTKLYKKYKENNSLIDFRRLVGEDLYKWVEDILLENGKRIDYSSRSYLLAQTSYMERNSNTNLFDLKNELMKVIDYSENDNITKEDVDKVLVKSSNVNVFNLLDAITRYDSDEALKIFNQLYLMNEPVQRIFYMITRQIRLIYSYKLYLEKGYSSSMSQKKMKIGYYEFNKIKNQSRNYTQRQLYKIMNELLKMDIALKTTGMDEKMIVEMFISKVCIKSG